MDNKKRKMPYLPLLVFINFLWAATFAATKIAVSNTGPVTVTFWVFLLASVTVSPFCLYEKRQLKKNRSSLAQRGAACLIGSDLLP